MVKELLEAGIIINRTHDTVLRFLPPYIIQKKHVDQVVEALDRALGAAVGTGAKGATSPRESSPQRLKPNSKQRKYRSAKALRRPKAGDARSRRNVLRSQRNVVRSEQKEAYANA
jgi:hypothetical protein